MANEEFISTLNEKYSTNFLANPDKVLMPLLHIKLGLMKNFVKAMAKHRLNGFAFLCKKFSKLRRAKLKERISLVQGFGKFLKNQSLKKVQIHWNYKLGMHLNEFT